MTRTRTHGGHDNIRTALRKMKDEANEKELELIDVVASVYEAIKDTQDKAVDKVKDTANTVNTSVHLHPWHYVGGAALCGFLAGFLLRR